MHLILINIVYYIFRHFRLKIMYLIEFLTEFYVPKLGSQHEQLLDYFNLGA